MNKLLINKNYIGVFVFQTLDDPEDEEASKRVHTSTKDLSLSCCGTKYFYPAWPMLAIPEPLIECRRCYRRVHKVCILYLPALYPDGYFCEGCYSKKEGAKKPENPYTAEQLTVSQLSIYIEKHVNDFFKGKELEKITIRVLFSQDEQKGIFAFQKIGGVDVCFFGMFVDAYGSNCSRENAGLVVISYIDSVKFLQPAQHRSSIYQQIIMGYWNYAKLLGYTRCNIQSIPAPEGEQYIFHGSPPDQILPDYNHLNGWYRRLLDKAKAQGVALDYVDGTMGEWFRTFEIRLQHQGANSPSIKDPDDHVSCLFMNRRYFKKYLKNNGHDFTSLRRAKYATLEMLYMLHTVDKPQQMCRKCQIRCTNSSWHCDDCNYDLCLCCFQSYHKH